MNRAVIDFTRHPDGSTTLKVGNHYSTVTGKFRPTRTFFNPTERQIDRLSLVPHTTVSSSNGGSGWWKLWRLK